MQFSSPDNYLGKNQSWQDVTASRAAGVTYTNTTGKTILVAISCDAGGNWFRVDDVPVIFMQEANTNRSSMCVAVMNGSTYSLDLNVSNLNWVELR